MDTSVKHRYDEVWGWVRCFLSFTSVILARLKSMPEGFGWISGGEELVGYLKTIGLPCGVVLAAVAHAVLVVSRSVVVVMFFSSSSFSRAASQWR